MLFTSIVFQLVNGFNPRWSRWITVWLFVYFVTFCLFCVVVFNVYLCMCVCVIVVYTRRWNIEQEKPQQSIGVCVQVPWLTIGSCPRPSCCCSRTRTRAQQRIRRPRVVCSSCINLCLLGACKNIIHHQKVRFGSVACQVNSSSVFFFPFFFLSVLLEGGKKKGCAGSLVS